MEPLDGPSVLARLERAELAAREQRLDAAIRAERIIARARERAAAIDAGGTDQVREAVDQLRTELLAEADALIAAFGREPGHPGSAAGAACDPDRSRAAVELVVAAVLGETSAAGDAAGRSAGRVLPSARTGRAARCS